MTKKEYKDYLNYELYNNDKNKLIDRIRIKYFQPNTNCIYLCRKMWYLYSKGFAGFLISKFIYLKIYRKYGCCIYPNIEVGKGFFISHPVGIVIGKCKLGNDFRIYQNCSIGVRKYGEEKNGYPIIGNNIWIYSNSVICGNIKIVDNVTIGANSLVNENINEGGTYCGTPVKKVK